MSYQSVNPYDGKTLKTFEQLTDEQLETALGAGTNIHSRVVCYKLAIVGGVRKL